MSSENNLTDIEFKEYFKLVLDDNREFKREIKEDIHEIKEDTKEFKRELKEDIHEIREEFKELKDNHLKHIERYLYILMGTMGVITTLIVGIALKIFL
jgi:L-lactate utilization protein LutB